MTAFVQRYDGIGWRWVLLNSLYDVINRESTERALKAGLRPDEQGAAA